MAFSSFFFLSFHFLTFSIFSQPFTQLIDSQSLTPIFTMSQSKSVGVVGFGSKWPKHPTHGGHQEQEDEGGDRTATDEDGDLSHLPKVEIGVHKGSWDEFCTWVLSHALRLPHSLRSLTLNCRCHSPTHNNAQAASSSRSRVWDTLSL